MRAKVYSITAPIVTYPLFTLFDRDLFGMVWQWTPMVRWGCIAVAAGAGLAWTLWKFHREGREHWDYVCFVGMGLCVILLLNTSQINHALAPQEPEQVMAEVLYTSRHHSSRGGEWHTCRVQVNDEEMEFHIRRTDYDVLESGDRVPIFYNEGGLGITYSWLDRVTWERFQGT